MADGRNATVSVERPADPVAGEIGCPGCGYSLRGLTEDRCPECGLTFDRAALEASPLPWEHRAKLGNWRAYWKTVWLLHFGKGGPSEWLERPIDFRSAWRFMRVHVVAAGVLVALVAAALTVVIVIEKLPHELMYPLWTGALATPVALLAALGVPTYFCHPRGMPIWRQNRGIALSYYLSCLIAEALLCLALLGLSLLGMLAFLVDELAWWVGLIVFMTLLVGHIFSCFGRLVTLFYALRRRVFDAVLRGGAAVLLSLLLFVGGVAGAGIIAWVAVVMIETIWN